MCRNDLSDIEPLALENGWKFIHRYNNQDDAPGVARILKFFSSVCFGDYDRRYQRIEIESQINQNRKSNPNAKVVGVLFTGGVDSTALVIANIERGNIVVPIYNRINNTVLKFHYIPLIVYAELKQTVLHPENLMPIWKGLSLDPDTFGQSNTYEGFIQQPYNMFSLGYISPEMTNLIDEFQIGIYKGDQSVPYIGKMKQLYESTFALSHVFGITHDELKATRTLHRPTLTFPLRNISKKAIIKKLKQHGMDWLPLSCENPDISVSIFAKLSDDELKRQVELMVSDENIDEVSELDFPVGIHIGISDCSCCHSCERSGTKEDFRGPRTIYIQAMEIYNQSSPNSYIADKQSHAHPDIIDLRKAVTQPGAKIHYSKAYQPLSNIQL